MFKCQIHPNFGFSNLYRNQHQKFNYEMSHVMMKTIVDGLNGPPFNMNLTMVAFDSFRPEKLLQILSDVLIWIHGGDNVDIRSENADETAVRILNHLRVLKYPPPRDLEQMQAWRLGILEGSKEAVYPILEWVFNNVDRLKERIYLSNYLTFPEIPMEEQSPEVQRLLGVLEQRMSEFKNLHSRIVEIRSDYTRAEDVQSDLKTMSEEKEHLMKRIEKSKNRVGQRPNLTNFLSLATQYRQLMETNSDLEMQREEQRDALLNSEQRVTRLQRVLEDAKREHELMDPRKLMEKYKQEIEVNRYLVEEKLQGDIKHLSSTVTISKRILATPTVTQDDLARLKKQVDDLNQEIMEMTLQRDKKDEDHEDKLSIYRHQAASMSRKKGAVADQLHSLRQELNALEDSVSKKKQELSAKTGNAELVTSVQYKKYVSQMRSKSISYKKKKAEMDHLNTELNVLQRTVEVLQSNWDDLKNELEGQGRVVIDNIRLGTAEQRPKTAKPQKSDLSELKAMVKELSDRVNRRRQEVQERSDQITSYTNEHKRENEEFAAREASVKAVEKDFENRKNDLESEIKELEKQLDSLTARQQRAEHDTELHSWFQTILQNPNGADEAVRRLEKEHSECLAEIDKLTKSLRDTNSVPDAADQMAMWKSLITLFNMKIELINSRKMGDHPIGDKL